MKKIILFIIFLYVGQVNVYAGTYDVDTEASNVKWIGTKVTGQHDGEISIKSGQLQWEKSELLGGSAQIDMTSLVVKDVSNPTYNKKLENHLKNEDFFDVIKYPIANLKILSANKVSDSTYSIEANFTIKGETKKLSFDAEVKEQGGSVIAKALIKIDRTDFSVRYGSGKFFQNLGDKMIHDDFTLEVDVIANTA